jgi:prepilin-type N-terminal cleavage/methylation domain-containing protein/prepilin-type processing-associated H-X9-DG protein
MRRRNAFTLVELPSVSREKRGAFTLVELLVVIGIIAVLVGILLPALNKARQSANTMRCASNLRQIAMAMLSYANNNKGRLLPCVVNPGDTIYPSGLMWANELVAQKYLSAPTGKVGGLAIMSTDSVFRCPLGMEEPLAVTSGFSAVSPRDAINQQYLFLDYPNTAAGVATWYTLNAVTHEDGNNGCIPGGSVDAAFAWYNGKSAGMTDRWIRDKRCSRTLSMMRKPSQMVMAFDGNAYNWASYANTTGYSARISGRHGVAENGGKDGTFNCAFFDGHVVPLPTYPYTKNRDNLSVTKNTDAIFWIHDQY